MLASVSRVIGASGQTRCATATLATIGRSQHLINAMLAYFSFVAGASTSLVLIGKKMVSYYQHRIIA